MPKTLHKPIIYQPLKSTHEETGPNDALDPNYIAISETQVNQIKAYPDGLYVGPYLSQGAFYVAASGSDVPTAGSLATPFQTLGYCLSQLTAQEPSGFTKIAIIALKAGETFTFPDSFYMRGGKLSFTFFGDPTYGSFNSPLIGGTTFPSLMADLQRPIIQVGIAPATVGGSAGIVMIGREGIGEFAETPMVILNGVQVNLPSGAHGTGNIDFIKCANGAVGRLTLDGAIVNMSDPTSQYGLLGMEAWSECKVYQFASQLKVAGTLVAAGDPVANLSARQWFFKFYQDFLGNNQTFLNYSGNTGTPGSGMMTLSWSDVAAMPVIPTKTNLGTYPVLNDPAAGLTNYFFNLTRDQQQRPLNVWSPRLF